MENECICNTLQYMGVPVLLYLVFLAIFSCGCLNYHLIIRYVATVIK